MLSYLPKQITKAGFLLFEIGYDQREEISALAEKAGLSAEVHSDFGGNPRMAILRHR
jgi:methylase of polypeptide subunit release factors